MLADIARRHEIPGIVAGVLRIDRTSGTERRFVASTGVANTRTGVATTSDTLCQIGSITKVATATMLMQLCEEGKLTLDTEVVEVLPDFTVAGAPGSGITIRHLLTHSSGIDGDLFLDTGRGDDCLAKYVAALNSSEALFSPGSGWSYCNSGFVVAGRVVEMLDGRTWDESLRERISRRLGLRQFFTLPEEVLGYRAQHGHVRATTEGPWVPARMSTVPRAMGPAGLITSSADDLLDFAAAFLRDGVGQACQRLLSRASVEAMTSVQLALDPAAASSTEHWGLGWAVGDWGGTRVYWHGGATIGNKSWLYVLPDRGVAIVAFCNGGAAPLAGPEIFGALARECAGVSPNTEARPSTDGSEATLASEWLGAYSDASTALEVFESVDGVLSARVRQALNPGGADATVVDLLPAAGQRTFVARLNAHSPWSRFTFAVVDGKPCAYANNRCLRKRD